MQPLEIFCKKRCPSKLCKFHRKTPVLEPLFNELADSSTGIFLWNLRNLWNTYLSNICERLLLFLENFNHFISDSHFHGKWTFFQNYFCQLLLTICGARYNRNASTTKYKNNSPYFLYFFLKAVFFWLLRVLFILLVFCVTNWEISCN